MSERQKLDYGGFMGLMKRTANRMKGASSSSSSSSSSSPQTSVLDKSVSRRQALGMMFKGAAATTAVAQSAPAVVAGTDKSEEKLLKWQEYFKGNFR